MAIDAGIVPTAYQRLLPSVPEDRVVGELPVVVGADEHRRPAALRRREEALPERGDRRVVREQREQHHRRQQQQPAGEPRQAIRPNSHADQSRSVVLSNPLQLKGIAEHNESSSA